MSATCVAESTSFLVSILPCRNCSPQCSEIVFAANRSQISASQLGMLNPRDAAHSFHKAFPASPLLFQDILSLLRDAVVSPPALPRFLHPAPLNPAAIL